MLRRFGWVFLFTATLYLTWLLYLPGIQGGFIFDDFPNLQGIGTQGGISDWDTFSNYVFNGFSGPLGRPIALATFVLDANYWPASATNFKHTNILLHLLAGVALCWLTLKLLIYYGVKSSNAHWAAVLNMAFWLLHPYMVSTTLYVVQRMAQLATIFIFLGLAGYLHGRILLSKGMRSQGYLWSTFSLLIFTSLAMYSKENGILIPLLALLIEICNPFQRVKSISTVDGLSLRGEQRIDWAWKGVFLWGPTLLIFAALAREIRFIPNIWPTRTFNQVERVLTESRILWEYLMHLYIPRIEGRGLFQDSFPLSRGLFEPISTIFSVVGLIALVVLLFNFRKKWTWISLAILFFLASHLIESTVVGLELYFEHRNYAAAAFLFLPIIMCGLWIFHNKSSIVAISGIALTLFALSFLTSQRVKLWTNTEALQNYWAISTTDSPRAQSHLAIQLFKQGSNAEGFLLLENAMQKMPNSALISMQWLLQKIQLREATPEDFERVKRSIGMQYFDAQAVMGLRVMVETLIEPKYSEAERRRGLLLVDAMQAESTYRSIPVFARLYPYLKGLLHLSLGEDQNAFESFSKAVSIYRSIESSLEMVARLGGAGYPREALELLELARGFYAVESSKSLRRSRAEYDFEILRLKNTLEDDLRSKDSSKFMREVK